MRKFSQKPDNITKELNIHSKTQNKIIRNERLIDSKKPRTKKGDGSLGMNSTGLVGHR